MSILLKGVKIFDAASDFHLQIQNILIQSGIVSYIGSDIIESDQVIDIPGLCVSAGWIDMNCWVGDPGLEYKEDFESAANAAAKGGFTRVLTMSDGQPDYQSKNAITYVLNRSEKLPIDFLPACTVTTGAEGKDLTEMIDLHQAGCLAFTDGENGIQGADVLAKALQYVRYFNGLILQRSQNEKLSQHGLMHEGIVSTLLGLKGIPALAEEVQISRDIQILEYTGGKIHFSLVSTAGGIMQIREAKAKGIAVTCDVTSYQVAFTDADLLDFDTNYKINPPFRSEEDKQAIIDGLQDGTIDALVSGHKPQDTESKNLEFDLAEYGIINLETAFAVANTYLAENIGLEHIIQKLTSGPTDILNIPKSSLAVNQRANLTLFHPEKTWVPTPENTASKSRNSPFFGKQLTGQVYGIIYKNNLVPNPEY